MPVDEVEVLPPVVVPPELEPPLLLDAPPEAPPVAPPRELLAAVLPARPVLPAVPPAFEELLLACAPPDEPVVPPLRLVPPELEAPASLDEPAAALPADELALLLLVEPPDDEPSEDDDTRLEPPCPPSEELSPLEPPELLSELRIDPAVSSALHPPRTGRRIKERTEKLVNVSVCLCFSECIGITF